MSTNSRTPNAPNTFQGFQDLFASKRANWSGKVGNNTWAVQAPGEGYALRYHETNVVTLYADGAYAFNTGGWATLTTADRMDEVCPSGWRVSRHEGEILLRGGGVRYLPGHRWRMVPDSRAPGGYRVEGGNVRRLVEVSLHRGEVGVYALEWTGDSYTFHGLDGSVLRVQKGDRPGARSGHPDAQALLAALRRRALEPVVRRRVGP